MGISTLLHFWKETVGMACSDHFLESRMLKLLDQWIQDPIFFFTVIASIFLSVASSLDFFFLMA